MDWLSYRLAQLSPRERGLLVLLALVVVPLAIAFLAAAPLLQDRAAARSAVAEAEAMVTGQLAACVPASYVVACPFPNYRVFSFSHLSHLLAPLVRFLAPHTSFQ